MAVRASQLPVEVSASVTGGNLRASQFCVEVAVATSDCPQDVPPPPGDQGQRVIRYNLNTESWDTISIPTYGAGPLHSMDSDEGQRKLFGAAMGNLIIARDPDSAVDSWNTPYACDATIGPVILSQTGEDPNAIGDLAIADANAGTAPTVSVLPNEISGSFTTIPDSCADPPQLPATSTVRMRRHYWLGVQSALANVLKFLQIKIGFPAEDARNEVYSVGLIPPEGAKRK